MRLGSKLLLPKVSSEIDIIVIDSSYREEYRASIKVRIAVDSYIIIGKSVDNPL